MSSNMARLLRFAIKYDGWHTYGRDRSTVDAIGRLCGHGVLETNGHRQFRLIQLKSPAE